MAQMPDIYNTDFCFDEQAAKDMIDFAVDTWFSRNNALEKIKDRELHYNGDYKTEAIAYIEKSTGKQSKTKFIPFHLARNKMNLLIGEYKRLPFNFTIHAVNPDAKNRKLEDFEKLYGLSLAKSEIDSLREMGFNIFNGVDIPSKDDQKFWNPESYKTKDEKILNTILKVKVPHIFLKLKLASNFEDLGLNAETHGRIFKNSEGIIDYESISAEDAIYLESKNDFFCLNSPFKGQRKKMFYGEIIKQYDLKKAQAKKLREVSDTAHDEYDQYAVDHVSSNGVLYNVFIVQWYARREIVEKVVTLPDGLKQRKIIGAKTWKKNKKKLEKAAESGKFELVKHDDWTVYEGVRVGKSLYINIEEKTENIKRQYNTHQWTVHMDYITGLMGTRMGKRLSKYDIMMHLDEVYDSTRFNLNREIGSLIGNTLGVDEAYLPRGKNVSDLVHEAKEDKMIVINSAADGNQGATEGIPGQFPLREMRLGDGTILQTLVNVCMDIERLMDRISGITESRQGVEKASTTATANQNNLQSSRSQTYDLFDFMEEYSRVVVEMLAEKTKLNWAEISSGGYDKVMSDSDHHFMKVTKDIMMKSYGAVVSPSQKEEQVKQGMFELFLNEINAGAIHTSEVARFQMADSFVDAVDILENAKKRIDQQNREQMMQQSQNKQQENVTKQKLRDAEREDTQQHDKEMEQLKGQIEKALVEIKGVQDIQKEQIKSQQNDVKERIKQSISE